MQVKPEWLAVLDRVVRGLDGGGFYQDRDSIKELAMWLSELGTRVKPLVWVNDGPGSFSPNTTYGKAGGVVHFTIFYRSMSKSEDHSKPYMLESPTLSKRWHVESIELAQEFADRKWEKFVEQLVEE